VAARQIPEKVGGTVVGRCTDHDGSHDRIAPHDCEMLTQQVGGALDVAPCGCKDLQMVAFPGVERSRVSDRVPTLESAQVGGR
jgi:hypothetical protein